ncbi:hypothetical protein H0H92_002057 [Tricholoma furcatifolium]|nr:hypothetical protein H0H92_002057 [Tricholoma furcatifolium]
MLKDAQEEGADAGIVLHHPYVSSELHTVPSPSSSDVMRFRIWQWTEHVFLALAWLSKLALQLERADKSRKLDTFIQHATQFGFFLDSGRFFWSAMLPRATGDAARPSPALISASYLWAYHLTSRQERANNLEDPREKALLENTLHHLAQDLAGTHPHRVVHAIQAEVLLSYYYLKMGKMLQGAHHANSTLSLVIAAELHRKAGGAGGGLAPPVDAVEAGERVDAFWAVLVLNNHWAAIQGSQATNHLAVGMQSGSGVGDLDVEVPWPVDSYGYGYGSGTGAGAGYGTGYGTGTGYGWYHGDVQGVGHEYYVSGAWFLSSSSSAVTHTQTHTPMYPGPLASHSGSTVKSFLDGNRAHAHGGGTSEKALHAKASILFERATAIHSSGDKRTILQSGTLAHLDALIDSTLSSLSSLSFSDTTTTNISRHAPAPAANTGSLRLGTTVALTSVSTVTQMMLYAATIKLHRPFLREIESSYRKTVSAAKAIARIAGSLLAGDGVTASVSGAPSQDNLEPGVRDPRAARYVAAGDGRRRGGAGSGGVVYASVLGRESFI